MNRRIFRRGPARKSGLIAVLAAAVAAGTSLVIAAGAGTVASAAPARAEQGPGESAGLGPLTGLLPRDHLTLESAIQVNLDYETVRLPLYPGIAYARTPHQEKVWYILEDASTEGAADDLGVNFAPKLANIGTPGSPASPRSTSPPPARTPSRWASGRWRQPCDASSSPTCHRSASRSSRG